MGYRPTYRYANILNVLAHSISIHNSSDTQITSIGSPALLHARCSSVPEAAYRRTTTPAWFSHPLHIEPAGTNSVVPAEISISNQSPSQQLDHTQAEADTTERPSAVARNLAGELQPDVDMQLVQLVKAPPTCASSVVPEVCGVMAWFVIERHGWSFGAGCLSHTSPL